MRLIVCFFFFSSIIGARSRNLREDAFERSKTNYKRPSLSPPPSPDASPSDRQIYPNTLIVMVTTNNNNDDNMIKKNNYERETHLSPPAPESSTPQHPLSDGGIIGQKVPSPPPAPKGPPQTNQVSGDHKPPTPPAPKHGPPTHQVSNSGVERKARSPPPAPGRPPLTNQVSWSGLMISSSPSNQLVAST